MSNADEILKLKELLDNDIITQEEFEKKKKELLNSEIVKKDNVTNNLNNNIKHTTYNKQQKKSSLPAIIIGVFVLLMIFGIIIAATSTLDNQLKNIVGLNEEETKKAIAILNDCGISYGTITRNSTLDTENGKAYNISMDSDSNIAVIKIKENNIYSLRMIKIENKDNEQVLYKNGQKLSTLSDYITTSSTTTNTTTTEKFTLVSDEGSTDSYGYTTITGEIKNNTNKTYSYVQVTFNLYDESGAQIGTAMDNINNLEANGTWKFKAWGTGSKKGTTYRLMEITGW